MMRAFARSIVETVRHPLLILDLDLRVKHANSGFRRTFETSEEETEDRFLYDLGERQWDIPRLRELLRELRATGRTFEGFEVECQFAGIGRKVMLLNGRLVHRDEDQAPMLLLAIEDVTETKAAQDDLRRLNHELEARVRDRTAQLEAANRELEAFCYSVSHDLRAPLRAIDGFSEELLQSYGDRFDAQGKHYLARVRSASQRMGHLIDDLLNLSRVSRDEMRVGPVDLSGLVRSIVSELREREPGRQVTVRVEPDVIGFGDARLLRLALENLLDNAWKFTSKHGAATIEFGTERDPDGEVRYYVRDDGAGFDMAHAAKLFTAFHRLHNEREFPGTGIGLATVRRIIRRHGGDIRAESVVDRGTTFTFTLPGAGGS